VTDSQLYLAIGIPTLAVLFGILTNVIQWNAMNARFNSLESRFNNMDVKLDVKFDTLTGKVIDVDNRVTRIEAKLGIG
jgi:hypothetical protein